MLAVHISRSPSAVAGVGLAATLPQFQMALPAGVVTDPTDRRRTMAIAAAAAAAVLGVLALILRVGFLDLALLDGAAFLVGAMQEVLVSATGSALMPQVAVGDNLKRANTGLFAAQHAAGSMFGPSMAGVLIAVAVDAPLGWRWINLLHQRSWGPSPTGGTRRHAAERLWQEYHRRAHLPVVAASTPPDGPTARSIDLLT